MRRAKRVIYIICFACIMLIDWSRGSASWEAWAMFTNLIGVVMSIVMACAFSWRDQFIKGGLWKRYVAWLGIWLAGSGVGYYLWQQNPGFIFRGQFLAALLSIFCLGVIALRIWIGRKALKEKGAKFGHPVLVVIWLVMTVLMVCSPLDEIWQLYYLVIFGMFYYIPYEKSERQVLWISVADGVILGFLIIQTWAYGFRPYDVVRYSGAYSNCNMNALFYLVTYSMVLYRLHHMWHEKEQGNVKRRGLFAVARMLIYLLAAGLCGFMLMTVGRTALLIGGFVTVVFGFFELLVYRKVKFYKALLHPIIYAVCVVLMFPCVYVTVRYLPTVLHHPIWWAGEYSELRVHSYDPANSEKYIEFDELLEEILQRFAGIRMDIDFEKMDVLSGTASMQNVLTIMPSEHLKVLPGMKVFATVLPDVELMPSEDVGSAMGARQFIWKVYLRNLNLTGHEMEEGFYQVTETYHAWHAQNVFIQVLFYYGIPAGVLFIVLMAILGIQALRAAVKNRNVESIFLLLVWIVFVGYGLSECVWYMGQSVLFLMYLAPKVLIDERMREENNIAFKS